nr:uncharacterized protein LOC131793701 [Pocillopora verrucosa]
MAYQRTEYADKTMFMNSMADRKLKIQLDSIDFHRESIGKEIDREKKKIQKELADAENIMKNRLSLPDASSPNDGGKKLSPRLPRRYSTPQVLLSASVSPRNSSDVDKRSPAAIRRRISSEGTTDVDLTERTSISPTRPLSPTAFLLPPLSQPRRQSLPPIGAGGSLVAADSSKLAGEALAGSQPGTRRGSCTTGNKSSRTSLSPTSLSPRASPRKGSVANESELEEVASKVNRFLQRMELSKQDETSSSIDTKEEEDLPCEKEGETEYILPLSDRTVKKASTFQPSNFE